MTILMSMSRQQNSRFEQDGARWRAVCERDALADGVFLYAVITTGIYCRPSCAARQPKRENVTFYSTAKAAREAGYRACKRCRPEQAPNAHPHQACVLQACRLIESSDDRLSLADLAQQAGLSPHHFQRVFKSIVGLTPKQYEKACREQRLRQQLPGASTVTDAIYASGFASAGRFYAEAADTVGMRPAQRRAGGKGERIRFALGDCSLGAILVAASDKGVCAIALGDDPAQLTDELQRDFSDADLVGGDPAFEHLVANVVGLVEDPTAAHDVPLDIRGTAFQKQVWQALGNVKAGTTASYSQIAAAIGKPSATRAVAQACSANRLAVAIPCHRVVRRDGGISGYRWGVERKIQLLGRE